MEQLYRELKVLLEDFQNDRSRVADNTDLLMGYADDFYDMLKRLSDKISMFLYE